MINLFGEEYSEPPRKKRKKKDPVVQSWEDGFHKWSNREFLNESTHYGMCGFGVICNYCTDNSYGRPCVRALNAMIRENRIATEYIDYHNKSDEYYEIWFDGGIR